MPEIKLVSPPEAHYTVYKLTDPKGKVYIGMTGKPVEKRWDKGRGYSRDTPIRTAIDSIGWDAFEKTILCEKLTKAGAENLEKWFVEYYDSMDPEKGYNRYTGGSRTGAKASVCSRELHRRTNQAKVAENPECCRINRELVLAYYRAHPEARQRIALQVTAYLKTPEGRKFAVASTRPRPVRCIETGEIYRSQRAAEKITGFYGIHKVCSGIQSMSGGYHWEYVNK